MVREVTSTRARKAVTAALRCRNGVAVWKHAVNTHIDPYVRTQSSLLRTAILILPQLLILDTLNLRCNFQGVTAPIVSQLEIRRVGVYSMLFSTVVCQINGSLQDEIFLVNALT